MKVLLTNSGLDQRAGTELYVRDLARALQRRGHRPVVFSTLLGSVADDLRASTIPVVDDLRAIGERPDVIHGHHNLETLAALARFPGVPAVTVCHGWAPWRERPIRMERIRRYVAVSEQARDRLTLQHGIPADRVVIIPNFVDTDRFSSGRALPAVPRRALLYSNTAAPSGRLSAATADACHRTGMTLDVKGSAAGSVVVAPHDILGSYDVVFAMGRSALEAMALGCAVVVCGPDGSGPLVRPDNFDRLRALNFGARAADAPLDGATMAREIERFDPKEAWAVSVRVREGSSLDLVTERFLELYHAIIGESSPSRAEDEAAEISEYLTWLSSVIHDIEPGALEVAAMRETVLGRIVGRLLRSDTLRRAYRRGSRAVGSRRSAGTDGP